MNLTPTALPLCLPVGASRRSPEPHQPLVRDEAVTAMDTATHDEAAAALQRAQDGLQVLRTWAAGSGRDSAALREHTARVERLRDLARQAEREVGQEVGRCIFNE
ncbi:uncharacterized protein LOC117652039 [Thrips palmi]|uniref:Uncharacterized protein LOC117652039 n=1 Tax=Thrips palmi TaxID=161013 RepID=A0A6P9A3U8_THRPL|nr:uncharacterized protein LOC117652039 [Thrips palmi]